MSISGTLKYEITGTFTNILPIINNSSFTILSSTETNNIVSVEFEYVPTNNNDGFYFYNMNLGYNITKIISFGGIPLSRLGSQFRTYNGILPLTTTDTPTILDNTIGDYMFADTTFSVGVSNWNTTNITSMICMFINSSNFNEDISGWIVDNVTSMYCMFDSANSFNQNIGSWNIQNVLSCGLMLNNTALSVDNYNSTLNGWSSQQTLQSNINLGVLGLKYSSVGEVGRTKLINNYSWTILGDAQIGTLKYEITGTFTNILPIINNSSFTILSSTETNNIVSVEFEYVPTNNNDGFYFYNMNLGYNITKIISFGGIPLSRLGSQFRTYNGILPLTTTDTPTILDNTIGDYMFADTTFSVGVSNWNTTNITSMICMFINSSNFNEDISGWIVDNVTSMYCMFDSANSFNQNIGSWNIQNVLSCGLMLNNTALSVDNYNSTLNGWSSQQVQQNIELGAIGLEYSLDGETGRNTLINNYNWTITGDIFVCFMKDTMILILENGIEVERKVQELKNDDMIKISTGEYKKLVFIGTKKIDIRKNIDKIRIMKQGILGNNLPNKNLLVTSGHSVLFKNLKNVNEYYNENIYNNNVEGYYKIMSQHCKLFDHVKPEELTNIKDGNNVSYYHFVLENKDEEGQYGVYSNGILSETMALSFSKKNFY